MRQTFGGTREPLTATHLKHVGAEPLWQEIMFSFFDKLFHPFECTNPNCRHKFYGLSRWLIHGNEVVCPKCGTCKILDESRASDFGDKKSEHTQSPYRRT